MESWRYVQSDYERYYKHKPNVLQAFWRSLTNASFGFLFWLRFSASKGMHTLPCKVMKKLYGIRCHFEIPSQTRIGYGLYLGHPCGIIINPTAIIGNNVNLSQFTTIGSNHGHAATIGDNVYIGPSVCVVEDVHIGSGAVIGAGAVVVKDIPENAVAAGVPAKVIKMKC